MASNTTDFLDLNGTRMKIPDIVLGKVIPDVAQMPNYRSLLSEQQALLQEISDHTQSLAELRRIADAACESAEMAKAKAKKADIKSWVSIGIAFLSLVAEVLIHHAELLSLFVQSTT